jgi:methylphosphotriester-DNA--protein-cysteine methyltransferase
MYIQMLRLWATSDENSPGWLRAGYKSDAAFNRAFTKRHGLSPGQWRRDRITQMTDDQLLRR